MDWSLTGERRPTRRGLLGGLGALTVGTALTGYVSGTATGTQSIRTLATGTAHETTLLVNDSGLPGLTAFVLGGVHGDEEAGYLAAANATRWQPDAGTLLVLPRANRPAIEAGTRTGPDGDLNRQFPLRQEPETALAREIWDVVEEFEPDLVIDLHESRGLYPDGGLGQSLGFSPGGDLRNAAAVALDDSNATIDGTTQFEPRALPSPNEYPRGVLVQRTAFERDIPSYIVETWEDLDLDARVRYQTALARRLLDLRQATFEAPEPRRTLKVVGSGPTTRFAFDVSGTVYPTDTLEDSDSVFESRVEGQVSTLGDAYQYTGRVESFDVTYGSVDDITVYVDGVEKTVDELRPDTESRLDILGFGTETDYQLTVREPFTGTENLGDVDWVFGDRAYGTVVSDTDTYHYRRDVERFAVTDGDADDIDLSVDGEATSVEELDETPTHEMHILGTGPTVRFQFATSGTVEATDTLESSDQVYDSAVEGQVSTQDDYYRFTGDVLSFEIIEGHARDIVVMVDGVEQSLADLNSDAVHELRIAGQGPTVRFETEVDGLTYPTATLEDSDAVGVSRIEGQVSIAADRYLFTGDITSFTVTYGSADDLAVFVDGTERSLAELNAIGDRTLRVAGAGPTTRFTFTTDETVAATDTLESSDVVYDQSVAGQVSTRDDTYRFEGDIVSFTVTQGSAEDIRLYVDGSEVSVADLNPDWVHDLRVAGTGPEVQFTVETSGATYPTATLEDTDAVADSRIEGQVSVADDRYLFTGAVDRFEVTQGTADEIEVYVDGERRSPGELSG